MIEALIWKCWWMKDTKNTDGAFILVVRMYQSQYVCCLVNEQDVFICMNFFVIGPCTTDISSVIGPFLVTSGILLGFLFLGLFVGREIGCCDGVASAMLMPSACPSMRWQGCVHVETMAKAYALTNAKVRLTTHVKMTETPYTTTNIIARLPVYMKAMPTLWWYGHQRRWRTDAPLTPQKAVPLAVPMDMPMSLNRSLSAILQPSRAKPCVPAKAVEKVATPVIAVVKTLARPLIVQWQDR